MKQLSICINTISPLSAFVGYMFPFLLQRVHCCRAEVISKRIERVFLPKSSPGSPTQSYDVGVIKIMTPDGNTEIITNDKDFHDLIVKGDTLPVRYQLSRRFDFNQRIKAKAIHP